MSLARLARTASASTLHVRSSKHVYSRVRSSTASSPSNTNTTATANAKRASSYLAPIALASLSLAVGYALGQHQSSSDSSCEHSQPRILPSGLPRTCCDEPTDENLTEDQRTLSQRLGQIVGSSNVLDGRKDTTNTSQFLKGARLGAGNALAIVTPRGLKECVECVQAIVDADCTILPQGANTGLTGGSVPRNSNDKRRPTVVISMKYLDTVFPIDNGDRVVCLAGVGLATLSNKVQKWFPNRESHSILGSTFLNPTTAAGVAFGSGGTQLRKGSAYTDRALYVCEKYARYRRNRGR